MANELVVCGGWQGGGGGEAGAAGTRVREVTEGVGDMLDGGLGLGLGLGLRVGGRHCGRLEGEGRGEMDDSFVMFACGLWERQ